jgi:anthranilate synthase component 1
MNPDKENYKELAGNHDIIPVFSEFMADMDTPVSVLYRFVDRKNAFLLESMEGDEKWGRYSFIGIDPELILEFDHTEGYSGRLQELRSVYRNNRVARVPGLPRFFGGAVGYIGYEAIGEFEHMPKSKASRAFAEPKSRFLKADKLIVFDNFRHTIKLVYCSRPGDFSSLNKAYEEAQSQLETMRSYLRRSRPVPE